MQAYLRFLFFYSFKVVVNLFFNFRPEWLSRKPDDFKDIKMFLLLNHTSLCEPMLFGAFPNALVWNMAKRFVYPVAEKTLKRPFVGRFYKLFSANTVSLTRSRDESWDSFLNASENKDSLIGIAPEGRMKRLNGLDNNGQAMTVKSGIVDLLKRCSDGKILILYSAGLHHIQSPGSGLPKLFKNVDLKFEILDLKKYKEDVIKQSKTSDFKASIIADLESRRDLHCEPHHQTHLATHPV